MAPRELALLVMSVLTSVAGQFFLKTGALRLGQSSFSSFWQYLWGISTNAALVTGLACYGLGALAYILLLTRVNLSVAAPAISLNYVFATMLGYWFFREPLPVLRLVGLGLIVGGVCLVVWKS